MSAHSRASRWSLILSKFALASRWVALTLGLATPLSAAYAAPGQLDAGFAANGVLRHSFGFHFTDTSYSKDVAVLPDGKLLTTTGLAVVRHNADGSLDESFGYQGRQYHDGANDILLANDKIIITVKAPGPPGGMFGFPQGTVPAIARLNADGQLDTTFGGGGTGRTAVPSMDCPYRDAQFARVVEIGGKYVAVGQTTCSAGGFTDRSLLVARFHANGMLDTSFNGSGMRIYTSVGPGTGAYAVSLAVIDGKVVIGGGLYLFGQTGSRAYTLRLLDNGNPDPAYGAGTGAVVYSGGLIAEYATVTGMVQANGKTHVLVYAGMSGSNPSAALVRINADGAPDGTFGTSGVTLVPGIMVPLDMIVQGGKLRISGSHTYYMPPNTFKIASLNFDGTSDAAFGGGTGAVELTPTDVGNWRAVALALKDDKLVAVATALGNDHYTLFRLNGDGSADSTFGGGDGKVSMAVGKPSTEYISQAVLLADGKMLAIGNTNADQINGNARMFVMRLMPNGSLDSSFANGGFLDPGTTAFYYSIVALPDGRFLLAGRPAYGASEPIAVSRFLANGTPDTTYGTQGVATFVPGEGQNSYLATVLAPDGKLLLRMSRVINGYSHPVVARLNANGTVDTTLGGVGYVKPFGTTPVNGSGVAVQPDGKILFSGYFNGTPTNAFVSRLNADGSFDNGFGSQGTAQFSVPSSNSLYVGSGGLALDRNGRVTLAFTAYAEGNTRVIAAARRFLQNGAVDASFNGGNVKLLDFGGACPFSVAMSVHAGDKLLLGGAGGCNPNGFGLVRLDAAGALDATFGVGGVAAIPGVFDYSPQLVSLLLQPDGKIVGAGTIGSDIVVFRAQGGPVGIPDVPVINSVVSGAGQITVTFAPGYSGGDANVSYTANCGGVTQTGSSSPITVSGLTIGNQYTCTVTAQNSAGASAASAPSAQITVLPSQLATRTITSVAGTGIRGYSQAPSGLASESNLSFPTGVAVYGNDVYVVDQANHRIRKISNGQISTVVGTGTAGFAGDGGFATSANLNFPSGIAFDSSGNMYIADSMNHRIRVVSAGGVITTFAGTGTAGFGGDGGSATSAQFSAPYAVAVANGMLYVADRCNHRIRRINLGNWIIQTVAGNGNSAYGGDGIAATGSSLNHPTGIAVDASGALYIADMANHRVRKVGTDGFISTLAGNGTAGFSGDEGGAHAANLDSPSGVAVDSANNVFIADSRNNRVRFVNALGIIRTVAGNGVCSASDSSTDPVGDDGPASLAVLNLPWGVAMKDGDPHYLYIADQASQRVRRVSLDKTVDSIVFLQQLDVPLSSVRTSEAVTPAGFNIETSVSISNGSYSIGCTGTFTAVAGILAPGQSICVRHTAANTTNTWTTTTLTIGGVAATFSSRTVMPPDPILTVAKGGNGAGTVTSVPSGIDCGATCTKSYAPATSVTLSAAPAAGSAFVNWTGVSCAGGNAASSCTFTLSANITVTANFALNSSGAARNDFNDDGRADILLRNPNTGENYLYPMNGTSILAGEGYIRTVPAPWDIAGLGDFDGNGTTDILLRNSSTGENYIYFMNGTTIASEGYVRTVPLAWSVAGVADFDGDGKADILLRNLSTGENYLYPMDGLNIKGTEGYIRTVASPWTVAGLADFNGDGRADILLRNTTTGENYLYPMNGTSILGTEGYIRTVPLAWDIAGLGDFDGDGKADILLRNPTTGENYLYPMDGTSIKGTEGYIRTVPLVWAISSLADFDGDGKVDILLRNTSTGENYLYPMDGTNIKPTEGYIRTVPLNWNIVSK
jgi:uncharacterized delta-60 repeat protein